MPRDYRQLEWGPELEEDWRNLLSLAIREDLDRIYDWTTLALVPETSNGGATMVARQDGVIAGLPAARVTAAEFDRSIQFQALVEDGASVTAGQPLVQFAGPARSILTAERTMLNVVGHLSGIATLTRKYIDAVRGTAARIYDTRKTTPGWRKLEKYAVRMGGGFNHRLGLYDAVLIKDNHLQQCAQASGPAEVVVQARKFLESAMESGRGWSERPMIEVEVDSLEQLDQVLPTRPDIVLLDNMSPPDLREAVRRRDGGYREVELEASGGVNLVTVGEIAKTGVDRISVGAITHSAPSFDVALDWQ